jgi:hypothetical protein
MRTIYNGLILVASAALVHASPLLAEVSPSDAPPASIAAWVGTVNAQLEEATARTRGTTGSATAIFRRASNGRPTDIKIIAATPAMEHAARGTLARLGQLPPLPSGVGPDQRIKLQLLFDDGSDVYAFEKKVHVLLAQAEAANMRFPHDRTRTAANFAKTQ